MGEYCVYTLVLQTPVHCQSSQSIIRDRLWDVKQVHIGMQTAADVTGLVTFLFTTDKTRCSVQNTLQLVSSEFRHFSQRRVALVNPRRGLMSSQSRYRVNIEPQPVII